MILTIPRTKIESIYAMYGCLTGYRKRMGWNYLISPRSEHRHAES